MAHTPAFSDLVQPANLGRLRKQTCGRSSTREYSVGYRQVTHTLEPRSLLRCVFRAYPGCYAVDWWPRSMICAEMPALSQVTVSSIADAHYAGSTYGDCNCSHADRV